VVHNATGCSEKGKTIVNIFDDGLFILSKRPIGMFGSLVVVAGLGYLGYHFREPLKAFIELKLSKRTEPNQ
jgi:hypothetical protein